ncbi:glycoside hydrolase family 71 protein [Pontoporia blainvillei]|uniref:Glycoside hydrolase family 71 protein n=1 Tax=Pontoporia blainvillei TaxID=48723 RepID=A0ABX0SDA3_PONBL|nr:glycoside hydrolase family 71 protein [Pontoporia blainvillei]
MLSPSSGQETGTRSQIPGKQPISVSPLTSQAESQNLLCVLVAFLTHPINYRDGGTSYVHVSALSTLCPGRGSCAPGLLRWKVPHRGRCPRLSGPWWFPPHHFPRTPLGDADPRYGFTPSIHFYKIKIISTLTEIQGQKLNPVQPPSPRERFLKTLRKPAYTCFLQGPRVPSIGASTLVCVQSTGTPGSTRAAGRRQLSSSLWPDEACVVDRIPDNSGRTESTCRGDAHWANTAPPLRRGLATSVSSARCKDRHRAPRRQGWSCAP